MHFEMHVTFFGEKGYYTMEKVLPLDVPLHKKSNYSQLKLAGKTGTEYDVFPKEPSPKDGDSGAMPKGKGNGKGAPGGPGGDLGGGPGGGPNGPGTPGGMSEERMKERMAAPFKDLKLDAAQQAKLDAILEKQLSETMTILGDSSQEMRARFGALRALREKYEVQYKEVLSAEQFEAYQKAREAARGQRGGRGGRGGGGGFGEPPGGPPVRPPGGEGGPVERDSPSPRPGP